MSKKTPVYFFCYTQLKGEINMGRKRGTTNIMRTPEEKENIILEYFNSGKGAMEFSRYTGIDRKQLWKWIKKYSENGIEGLRSKTGKCARKGIIGRPKIAASREEELERENTKLKIEIERLKKGYYVKGVGQRKEYVSINNRNFKSLEN